MPNQILALRNKYQDDPNERFFKELFDRDEYKIVKTLPVKTFLDIGALAGEFCAYVYDQADVIYAIEPFDSHYKELTENIEQFALTKIKPYHLALAGGNGVRQLEENARGGHYLRATDEIGTQDIATKTIARFMKDEKIEHIDLLKIDVEGAEREIFSAVDFKDVAEKIDYIIGEHIEEETKQPLETFGFSLIDIFKSNYCYKRNA